MMSLLIGVLLFIISNASSLNFLELSVTNISHNIDMKCIRNELVKSNHNVDVVEIYAPDLRETGLNFCEERSIFVDGFCENTRNIKIPNKNYDFVIVDLVNRCFLSILPNIPIIAFQSSVMDPCILKNLQTLPNHLIECCEQEEKILQKYFNYSIGDEQNRINLVLINTKFIINGFSYSNPKIQEIGTFSTTTINSISTDHNLNAFLDKNKFIYISFGSLHNSFFSNRSELLQSFLIIFNTSTSINFIIKHENCTLLKLPENVFCKNWLPQQIILNHKNIYIFITHGGIHSIYESIFAEVPMLGIPVNFDQPFNMLQQEIHGTAISLYGKISTQKLNSSIETIIRTSTFKSNVRLLKEKLFLLKPIDDLMFWINYVIKFGPLNFKNPKIFEYI